MQLSEHGALNLLAGAMRRYSSSSEELAHFATRRIMACGTARKQEGIAGELGGRPEQVRGCVPASLWLRKLNSGFSETHVFETICN